MAASLGDQNRALMRSSSGPQGPMSRLSTAMRFSRRWRSTGALGSTASTASAANWDSPRRAMMSVRRKLPARRVATPQSDFSTAFEPYPARSAARFSMLMQSKTRVLSLCFAVSMARSPSVRKPSRIYSPVRGSRKRSAKPSSVLRSRAARRTRSSDRESMNPLMR